MTQTIPTYPELTVDWEVERVIALPCDPAFDTFRRDARAGRVRSVLPPSSPGRPSRVADVVFVIGNLEWGDMSGHERDEFVRGQLDLGVRYRTATLS